MSSPNIVVEWLRSLRLGQYAESFLDNGYDDLEICKQIGEPDLDAIGVLETGHRNRLLGSVKTLREEGAASVYFTLEESQAIQEEAKESPSSGSGSVPPQTRFSDEYEEGKAELLRIPKIQLKIMIRDKLAQEQIKLSSQPYSTPTGERGYLEGLASRYADQLHTHYEDVLTDLEELRQRHWAELSPRIRVLSPHSTRQNGLVSSLSQPIYVPGKYSPSSCLSDREEDEIYGFTGAGAYGKQEQQRHPQQSNQFQYQHTYQNCPSPRMACFYDFQQTDRPTKKRTTLTRLLRHFKAYRKEKSSFIRPQPPQPRVHTPEELPGVLSTDHDRIRLLHKGSTFEETIHRLKMQEAMRNKKAHRDHEEALRNAGGATDDTYMYEDDLRTGHWYDEPPYESDPEEFLMRDNPPTSRLCFAMLENGVGDSGVISLRSAGDISLPSQQNQSQQAFLRQRASRESGDYAASDVNSVCSRLSTLSMETSRSEHLEMEVYHRLKPFNGIEPPISPGHSSDYAEQEELLSTNQPSGMSRVSQHGRGPKCESKSLSRKHHHHHHHHRHHHHHHKSSRHSSVESLPSASSTQALVSHMDEQSPTFSNPLARALIDSNSSPYDADSLRFKKGDIIEVLSMRSCGLWQGRAHNQIGHFKFTSVELLPPCHGHTTPPKTRVINKPHTLEQMLEVIQMKEHMSLFILNGYEDLSSFCEITEDDLDYLGFSDPENRAKILAAVQVLHDFEACEGNEWLNGRREVTKTDGVLVKQQEESNNLSQNNTLSKSGEGREEGGETFLPNIPVSRGGGKGGSEKSTDSGVSSASGGSASKTPPRSTPAYVNQITLLSEDSK